MTRLATGRESLAAANRFRRRAASARRAHDAAGQEHNSHARRGYVSSIASVARGGCEHEATPRPFRRREPSTEREPVNGRIRFYLRHPDCGWAVADRDERGADR